MDMTERVARVLAGQHYSRNAHGGSGAGSSAAHQVDDHWREFAADAEAVLRTMRDHLDNEQEQMS